MKWVILVILILAAAGAGVYFFVLKKPAEQEQPTGPAQPAAAQQPKELTDAEKKELAERKLEELRSLARTNPNDLLGLKALKQQIEQLGDRATIMKADAVYSTATQTHDDSARKAFDRISAEIKTAFEAEKSRETTAAPEKMKEYGHVLKMFDKYPAQFMSTKYASELQKLKEPVQKAMTACQAWEDLRFEAWKHADSKEYPAAIAKLNEFPERYRDSEWETVRQGLLAEYQSALTKIKTEKKKEEALTYYDLYHGQALDKSDWTGEGSFKIQDGVLIGESGSDTESVLAYAGGEDWVDMVLKLEMRLVRGSITIAVHGTEVAPRTLRYDPISLSTGILEANKWYKLTVKLRGKKYEVTADPPLANIQEFYGEKSRGPVAIWIKGNSELHVKSIKVGFFDKVPGSFANEAAKQQQDGRAKKPSEEEEEE